MNSLKDLYIFISKFIPEKCICIETGTQHDFKEDNKDFYSTLNLIEYICKPRGGMLYSFDIERENIELCMSEFEKIYGSGDESGGGNGSGGYDKYVTFIHGDSVIELKKLIESNIDIDIDLVLLDSKEFDEEHMLNEFKVIESYLNKKRGYVIMCDDIHNPSSVKWKKAIPYIKEKGLRDGLIDFWFEFNTPTGLFVAIKNG